MIAMQRGGAFITRSSVVRLGLVLAIAVVAVSTMTLAPWAWVPVVVGVLVAPWFAASAWHEMRGTEPRIFVTRWLLADGRRSKGLNTPNIGGIVEGALMLGYVVVAAWGVDMTAESVRLVLLGLAVSYAATCLHNIFADPAFYNPMISMPSWLEAIRRWFGVVATVAAEAITLPAPWTWPGRLTAGAICGLLLMGQVALSATDDIMRHATAEATNQTKSGKKYVAMGTHRIMTGPLFQLRSLEEERPDDIRLRRAVVQTFAAYREILEVAEQDQTIDWPGAVVGGLRDVVEGIGSTLHFDPPETLPPEDRAIAREVLIELAGNAAKSGATDVSVTLARHGSLFQATVVDDGPPIDEQRWMRPGGGLRRLLDTHQDTGLTITLEPCSWPERKVIHAQWNFSTPGGPK